MSPDAATSKEKPDKPGQKKLEVHVHNEDDGRNYEFDAKPKDKLQEVIAELYRKELRREQLPGDRLRCEEDGEEVFGFAELTFERYLADGHCPRLRWLFAGDTGGA